MAGFYSATRDRVMPPLHGLLLLRRVQVETGIIPIAGVGAFMTDWAAYCSGV